MCSKLVSKVPDSWATMAIINGHPGWLRRYFYLIMRSSSVVIPCDDLELTLVGHIAPAVYKSMTSRLTTCQHDDCLSLTRLFQTTITFYSHLPLFNLLNSFKSEPNLPRCHRALPTTLPSMIWRLCRFRPRHSSLPNTLVRPRSKTSFLASWLKNLRSQRGMHRGRHNVGNTDEEKIFEKPLRTSLSTFLGRALAPLCGKLSSRMLSSRILLWNGVHPFWGSSASGQ